MSFYFDIDVDLGEYVEQTRRRFDPRDSRMHSAVPAHQLIVYNPTKKVRQLRQMNFYTNQTRIDEQTVVVSIDGACRGNGTSSARAAWGVYFGPQSPHNASGILDATLPQTSTRAEIEALSQALDIIRNDVSRDFSLQNYHIRTDSSYLVQTFSAWIQGWIDNGGRNARGERAAHFDVLKKLHERLDDMTYGDDGGMSFKFWLVPREENTEADALANEALDARVTRTAGAAAPRVSANAGSVRVSGANTESVQMNPRARAFEPLNEANKMADSAKPRILSVSLHLQPFFDEMYGSLLAEIRAGSTFQRVEDGQSAIRMLSGNQKPHAVLITDEALTLRENAAVWDAVLKYVRQGGTAVVMGHFSTFSKYSDIKPFFAKAGLGWEAGSYTRTTLVLNRQVVGGALASKLVPEYSQKALFLSNAKASDAWYVTNGNSHVQSLVFSPKDAHKVGESPVLLASVGRGRLGYLGDVNGEEGSDAALLAMCGL